jgi:hypothetical protein
LAESFKSFAFWIKHLGRLLLGVGILLAFWQAEKYWPYVKSLKEFAPIGAIIVFIWGLYKFNHSNELSFRRPFWEKQLALYVEATSATSILATTHSESEWNAALDEFWRLYYGPLVIVESKAVVREMMAFKDLIEGLVFETRASRNLKVPSLNLARTCRLSIRDGLNLNLDQLTRIT